MEHELDVGCRFVQLPHKIAPVFRSAGSDESIKFLPDDQGAIALQSL